MKKSRKPLPRRIKKNREMRIDVNKYLLKVAKKQSSRYGGAVLLSNRADIDLYSLRMITRTGKATPTNIAKLETHLL